jgi:ATP-dependent Clp protease ATP-binding subunit ClpC
VFERFNEQARQVVVLAQDEARALRHNYIGTEHLLLALLREEEGFAARVLESFEIDLEDVRAMVARIVGQGDEVTTGQIPFTPRGKKVLELSLQEALSLGQRYIGTEHILLGLIRENNGVGARVLAELGADPQAVRNEVPGRLSGPGREALPPDAESGRFEGAYPVDLSVLSVALEEAKRRLIEDHRFEEAAALRERQRELQRLSRTIDSDLRRLGATTSQLPSDSIRREYDVKTLEGNSDAWASQVADWRQDGWEILAVVSERDKRLAILERRSQA